MRCRSKSENTSMCAGKCCVMDASNSCACHSKIGGKQGQVTATETAGRLPHRTNSWELLRGGVDSRLLIDAAANERRRRGTLGDVTGKNRGKSREAHPVGSNRQRLKSMDRSLASSDQIADDALPMIPPSRRISAKSEAKALQASSQSCESCGFRTGSNSSTNPALNGNDSIFERHALMSGIADWAFLTNSSLEIPVLAMIFIPQQAVSKFRNKWSNSRADEDYKQ